MHPFGEQLRDGQTGDSERRPAALEFEIMGDFCFFVRNTLRAARREKDYCELSLVGAWT